MSELFQERSFRRRRQRIADEMAQMKLDADHWNRLHPNEEPIVVDVDLTVEVAALKIDRGLI
jgi:hypothetical protein